MKTSIFITVLLGMSFFYNDLNAQDSGDSPEQAIAINPLGFITKPLVGAGISYIEYERMVAPFMSVAFHITNMQYEWKETETNYTYDETGNGVGVGVTTRFYVNSDYTLNGFYGGFGFDVISVKWKWNENDYGWIGQDSGTTASFLLLFQAGYKIRIDNFYIDTSLYGGYVSLDTGNGGVGVLAFPAVTLGMVF